MQTILPGILVIAAFTVYAKRYTGNNSKESESELFTGDTSEWQSFTRTR